MCLAQRYEPAHAAVPKPILADSRSRSLKLPGETKGLWTTIEHFQRPREEGLNQKSRLTDWTWEGVTVVEYTGKVADVYFHVPVVRRNPFRAGGEENRYKDEIRRGLLTITDDPIPV